jgi:hypothetical protein
MAAFLDRAGFVNLQRVGRHGLFADTSETVVLGTPISLNINAHKPSAPMPAVSALAGAESEA